MASTEEELNTLNPTGGLFADYTPHDRVKAPLGPNMTSYAVTHDVTPDTTVKVYRGIGLRGASKEDAKKFSIVPGDFITTHEQYARDYAGPGPVLTAHVRAGDILDDKSDPAIGEYIYRPGAHEEVTKREARKERASTRQSRPAPGPTPQQMNAAKQSTIASLTPDAALGLSL